MKTQIVTGYAIYQDGELFTKYGWESVLGRSMASDTLKELKESFPNSKFTKHNIGKFRVNGNQSTEF